MGNSRFLRIVAVVIAMALVTVAGCQKSSKWTSGLMHPGTRALLSAPTEFVLTTLIGVAPGRC
jgi:hypothetical protein